MTTRSFSDVHFIPPYSLGSQALSLWKVGAWEQSVKDGHEWMTTGVGTRKVSGEAGTGKGESGTSTQTGQPRKGDLWSQGRLWLLSEGLCRPGSRHWRCSQRAGSKGIFRKTRGFWRVKGGKRRGGKPLGKEVRRAGVMATEWRGRGWLPEWMPYALLKPRILHSPPDQSFWADTG